MTRSDQTGTRTIPDQDWDQTRPDLIGHTEALRALSSPQGRVQLKAETRVSQGLHYVLRIRKVPINQGLVLNVCLASGLSCLLTDQSKLEVRSEDAASYSNFTLLYQTVL